jgi:hypothetical protein
VDRTRDPDDGARASSASPRGTRAAGARAHAQGRLSLAPPARLDADERATLDRAAAILERVLEGTA